MNMNSIVAVIPARGGSKGLPGKNLKLLAGKPLLAWTIEAALASGVMDRIIVSTDDPAIAEVAKKHNAEIPFLRPEALARDDTSALEVALHVLDWLEAEGSRPEHLMWLQPTSPLRSSQDIVRGTELMAETNAPAVLSVCAAKIHPYHVLKGKPDGTLEPFVPSPLRDARRQEMPELYQLNGAFYLNRSDSLRGDRTFLPSGARFFVMPPERSVDIDTASDFLLAEALLTRPLSSAGGRDMQ